MNIFIKCDTDLLKALFNVNSFTMDLLYFETGKLPIQFIVSVGRLMYPCDDLISIIPHIPPSNIVSGLTSFPNHEP